MSMFEIYIIMQLDSIKTGCLLLGVSLLFIGAIFTMMIFDSALDKFRFQVPIAVIILITSVLLFISNMFLPSTKTALTMVAGEKITNNEQLKESVNKGVEILPKVLKMVDKYVEKKSERL